MAICVLVDANNAVFVDPSTTLDVCQFLLVSQPDLTTINGLSNLLAQYFAFDAEIFSFLIGAFIVTFITGFYTSRTISTLRK